MKLVLRDVEGARRAEHGLNDQKPASYISYMQNEFREKRRKATVNMRMMRDITMAILILGVATLLFIVPYLGLRLRMGDSFRITMGVLFAVYGAFRLYRGIKRDY